MGLGENIGTIVLIAFGAIIAYRAYRKISGDLQKLGKQKKE